MRNTKRNNLDDFYVTIFNAVIRITVVSDINSAIYLHNLFISMLVFMTNVKKTPKDVNHQIN